MGRWAQKSRRGGGGQALPAANLDILMTNAYAPFNGLFRYSLDVIYDGGSPVYVYNPGANIVGEFIPIYDPGTFVGWALILSDFDTSDEVSFYAATDAPVPPTNPAVYTLTPPAGYDPSTKPGVLVSITPT